MAIYHQLYERWSAAIASRVWAAGSMIPTETVLAREHDVSVGTVRKAIDLLVADGAVDRVQGKGTFVRRPTFSSSLFRFFHQVSLGHDGSIGDGILLSREVKPAPETVAKLLNLQPSSLAIELRRLRKANSRPLLYEEIWLPLVPFSKLMAIDADEFGGLLYPLYESLFDIVVIRARERLMIGAAHGEAASQLLLPQGTPTAIIERVALDQTGRAVEWRRSVGPGDHFSYEIDVR